MGEPGLLLVRLASGARSGRRSDVNGDDLEFVVLLVEN